MFNKWKNEKGQSMTEFALILPLVLILMMVPIDAARIIHVKIALNSAATEAISQIDYSSLGNISLKVNEVLNSSYGDVLDVGRVGIKTLSLGAKTKENYDYYVYTSEKAEKAFPEQFDKRDGNFTSVGITLSLETELEPLTPLGKAIFGKKVKIDTRGYNRNVYLSGYTP